MAFYTQKERDRASEIDLFTYLQRYEPEELVRVSANEYTTVTHSSLKMSPAGPWNWHKCGVTGRSALDYLVKVRGWHIIRAVKHINYCLRDPPPTKTVRKKQDEKPKDWQLLPGIIELPPKKDNDKRLIAYLCDKRCLAYAIVTYCIRQGVLYESAEMDRKTKKRINNAVFLGKDASGNVRYCFKRGLTDKRFVQEIDGSDKSYAFRLCGNPQSKTVHVFESAIDALSYASLVYLSGAGWLRQNYLSLAGGLPKAQDPHRAHRVPAALDRYLADYPDTAKIVLHLDNDEGGRLASKNLLAMFDGQYEVIDRPPPDPACKDVNDYLILYKQKLLKEGCI